MVASHVAGLIAFYSRLPVNDTNHLNVTQIGALLGKSKAVVSRRAAAGDFGKPYVPAGATFKRYSISAVERAAGRTLLATEIAAAREAHYYTGPANHEIRSDHFRRTITLFIAARDDMWKAALVGQKLVKFTRPPTFKGTPK